MFLSISTLTRQHHEKVINSIITHIFLLLQIIVSITLFCASYGNRTLLSYVYPCKRTNEKSDYRKRQVLIFGVLIGDFSLCSSLNLN